MRSPGIGLPSYLRPTTTSLTIVMLLLYLLGRRPHLKPRAQPRAARPQGRRASKYSIGSSSSSSSGSSKASHPRPRPRLHPSNPSPALTGLSCHLTPNPLGELGPTLELQVVSTFLKVRYSSSGSEW